MEKENQYLKQEIDNLRKNEWKIKDYESKISVLQQKLATLTECSIKMNEDIDMKNKKYQGVLKQLREFELILEELTERFREVEY